MPKRLPISDKTKAHFAGLLRAAGYRVTESRVALLSVLKASPEPLSIQELMQKLSGIRVDQATIYRIISVLEKMGVVRRASLRHGHADYEFVDGVDHHHVVCVKCKRVEDVPGCDSEEIARRVLGQAKSFSRLTQHSFEFFGICKRCDAH